MIVLLGEFNGKSQVMPKLKEHHWGRMWASYGPAWSYSGEPWGFDNGAWSAYSKEAKFDSMAFVRRLARAKRLQRWAPCVAVAPDIVAGGKKSLQFSMMWRAALASDWPWYLAVQDGMDEREVERALQYFSGLFLGGTDDFKRSAGDWCQMAHENGKGFHYARCNREGWLRVALDIGADSIDTTRPVRAFTGGEMGKFKLFEQIVTGKCPQRTFV